MTRTSARRVHQIRLLPLVVLTLSLAACGRATPSAAAPTSSPPRIVSLAPPAIPVDHAYLGAFVNPEHLGLGETAGEPGSNIAAQFPAFAQAIDRPVGILHFYMPFKDALPLDTLKAIEAQGATPLISWGCTDVGAVGTGADDATINSFARSLQAFGKPVFLRWYWEMNQRNDAGRTPAGDGCNGYGNGAGFVAAWRHIYGLFRAAGADNVAFVWCPGYSGGNFEAYYPGDAYVDWIGLDRYERTEKGAPLLDFPAMFESYDREWSGHGKPLMIAETAAMGSANQAAYLADVLAQAPALPDIKALVYFDATGPAGDWSLQGAGFTAFRALASSPYFVTPR